MLPQSYLQCTTPQSVLWHSHSQRPCSSSKPWWFPQKNVLEEVWTPDKNDENTNLWIILQTGLSLKGKHVIINNSSRQMLWLHCSFSSDLVLVDFVSLGQITLFVEIGIIDGILVFHPIVQTDNLKKRKRQEKREGIYNYIYEWYMPQDMLQLCKLLIFTLTNYFKMSSSQLWSHIKSQLNHKLKCDKQTKKHP